MGCNPTCQILPAPEKKSSTTDTQPFPAAKTVWTYRAIYRAGDAQTGGWSAPISIAVGG